MLGRSTPVSEPNLDPTSSDHQIQNLFDNTGIPKEDEQLQQPITQPDQISTH
jgi:hypothetical protein